MTSLALVQPLVADDGDRWESRRDLGPRVSTARAAVVALERVRLTGFPVEIRQVDHDQLSGADLLELAEAVCEREQAPVRVRWTDRFDGYVFEAEPDALLGARV